MNEIEKKLLNNNITESRASRDGFKARLDDWIDKNGLYNEFILDLWRNEN